MKKLILLGLLTMITFSASAQIEMYTEKKVEHQTLTQEEVDERLVLMMLKNRDPYFWGNLKYVDPNIISDTLYSLPSVEGNYYCLSTNQSEDTLRIAKFPYGEYFYVKNIFYGNSLEKLFSKFNAMIYVNEKISDSSFKKGYFNVSKMITTPDGKVPIWKYWFTETNRWDEVMHKVVYVLENNDVTYYITKERTTLCPPNNSSYAASISTPELADFISIKSYNFLKENYVGKEVYYYNGIKRKSFKESLELYKFEKVLVKDGGLYGELRSSVNDKKVLTPIGEITTIKISAESNFAAGLIELTKQDPSKVLDGLGQLAISESKIAVDTIKTLDYNWCLKSDADSLLAKWAYEEEQVALAKKKQQSQYKDEMIRKYGEKFGSLIVEGKVCLDMTKEMCLEALGYPCEENSSETALGKFDIWTYDCLWYNAGLVSNLTYITFTDGKISGITN